MISNWLKQNANQMPLAAGTVNGFLGCVAPLHQLSELRATSQLEPYADRGITPGFTGDIRQVRRSAPRASS